MRPLVHKCDSVCQRKTPGIRQSGTKARGERLLDRSSVKGSSVFYDPIFFDISRGRLTGTHSWTPHLPS